MAKSDYLCCSVCDNKIVYADTMPGMYDEHEITAVCSSCAAAMVAVVRDCQAVLTSHLTPDGITRADAIDKLFDILDGTPAKTAFPMLFQKDVQP